MSMSRRTTGAPFVTTTLEVRACDLLVQLLPVGDFPGKDLELLHIVSEVGHVLGRECFI